MNSRAPDNPEQVLTPRRIPLPVIAGVWLLFWLWTAQQSLLSTITSGREVESWLRPFETSVVAVIIWTLLTRPLMWNTRRIRDSVLTRSGRILQHLGSFLIMHVVDMTLYRAGMILLGEPTRPFLQVLVSVVSLNLLTYAVVVMATTAIDYYDAYRERTVRAAQLETQLALTQFQVLRAQLQPHFLFNSLNAISALMHKDVGRADRMLARLSELLRMAVDTAATPEIRLVDEVEFVKRYLETEQMRFGDRLAVQLDVPSDAYDALVPTMLLQPLVENAVRHGVAPQAGPARVEVRVRRNGARLGIVVRDTGKGFDPDHGQGREGVGLRSTRERLEKLYGNAQELVLANLPEGGFETRVTLPFRRDRENAE